jgi:hypothetical protein
MFPNKVECGLSVVIDNMWPSYVNIQIIFFRFPNLFAICID